MTRTTPASGPGAAAVSAAPLSLKSRVISGSMWTIGSYGASQVLRFGGNVLLAAFLNKEAFGLMALVSLFNVGLTMFSDFGIGASIIQSKRGEDEAYLNTAWTIHVIRGFALSLASVLLARPFALLYGQPELAAMIPAAGLAGIIQGFQSTKWFSRNRQIALARVTVIELVSQASGMVVMVLWCWVTRSVWGIVWGMLIGYVVKTVLTHTALDGERNRFVIEREAKNEMIRFGRWIFISSSLSFLAGQIDRLLLGKLVPIGTLGLYNIAMGLASMPPMVVAALVGGVLFPLLSHHSRTDTKAYERALLEARRVMLEGGIFLFAGLALLSPALFHLVYKPEYWESIWMAQLLPVAMWAQILMLSVERAVLAVGDSRTMAMANAISLAAKIAVCYAGYVLAGIGGFIVGLALGFLAGHVPLVIFLRRRGIHVLRQDLPYTAVAVLLVGSSVLIQRWVVDGLTGSARVWTEIGTASVVLIPLGIRAAKIGRAAIRR